MSDDRNKSSNQQLLPCPFCRQSALKFWDSREAHEECEGPHTDGSNDVTWAVVCDATNYGCGASAGFQPTKEAAAARWNARVSGETPCAACVQHEKDMTKELEARDANADYADQLTAMIGVYFETDHGEHTSGNFPWENAIETMRVAIGTKGEPPSVKTTTALPDRIMKDAQ